MGGPLREQPDAGGELPIASALILTEKAQQSGGRKENALISDSKTKPASKLAKKSA
jgi:hypothetical protein